jgi:hypothetical protein
VTADLPNWSRPMVTHLGGIFCGFPLPRSNQPTTQKSAIVMPTEPRARWPLALPKEKFRRPAARDL